MSGTTETGIPANSAPDVPVTDNRAASQPDTGQGAEKPDYGRNSQGDALGEDGKPLPEHPLEPLYVPKRLARYTYIADQAKIARDAAIVERDQERQRAARFETQLEIMRRTGQQPGQEAPQQPQQPQIDPEAIRREAMEAATTRLRAEAAEREEAGRFDRETNAMVDKGRAAHPDFDKAITGWQQAGLNIQAPGHRQLVDLINSLPDGAALFHKIGTNPDLAEHIANLSPVRAAYEIRGLSASTTQTASSTAQALAVPQARPDVSSAPRPPQGAAPRGSSTGTRNIYDPTISMEEFARAYPSRK